MMPLLFYKAGRMLFFYCGVYTSGKDVESYGRPTVPNCDM